MSHFNAAWQRTHGIEGGYSNNPKDPGGETMHGVTARVARAWGYTGPMRLLPLETARRIGKQAYWDPLRLDQIAELSPPVALELFDTNYNLWARAAAKFLQAALNGLNREGKFYGDIPVDGLIGKGTVDALRAFLAARGKPGEVVLLRLLNAQQAVDYLRQTQENPKKEEFLYGWVLHRVTVDA